MQHGLKLKMWIEGLILGLSCHSKITAQIEVRILQTILTKHSVGRYLKDNSIKFSQQMSGINKKGSGGGRGRGKAHLPFSWFRPLLHKTTRCNINNSEQLQLYISN